MVLDDEFDTGTLNTSLWSPDWFGSGSVSNGTVMLSSNVSVGANGLALQLNSPQSGGLVSTNPDDNQPGHTGFQIAPTPTQPVFVEFKATLPATASGTVANWPALWLDGQVWPEDGEIDVMEGLGGTAAFHIHYAHTHGRVRSAGNRVGDIENRRIAAQSRIRKACDDFMRSAEVVNQRKNLHTARVELPVSDVTPVGAPAKSVADVQFFFIDPVGSAVDQSC